MAKQPKLYRLLPLFKHQEALMTWGMMLDEVRYRQFADLPSGVAWRQLMAEELGRLLQMALDEGAMMPADLDQLAETYLPATNVALLPGGSLNPQELARALLNQERTIETPVGMIEAFLDANLAGDDQTMSSLVEAANKKYPPEAELNDKMLFELEPVERIGRIVSNL
ncbi:MULTISPECIES: hypothetical protein [Pseudomonas aeruginosa group]|uniref:hypothetical protein n=1 Tax=Pseudomonas aeruginosa group TaxID=136841 RepID=UPI0005B3ED70|nr:MULTISPECIES: hypothetical protein [Pseudomonas aeruginosa group]EIU1445450.1 hypothetical protein [Pseudomonas aeruginosa]EJH4818754.1 hypothetical protein [Pseudomonas aeruginosa]EKL8566491.1 hypothetical protein [Pseudomonas aeruginosa]EKS3059478.1 hypothetical protein [Pseudomonas aeruginosa]EKU4838717.1 hypothetical protein [Pseudomonas aeruginosa]